MTVMTGDWRPFVVMWGDGRRRRGGGCFRLFRLGRGRGRGEGEESGDCFLSRGGDGPGGEGSLGVRLEDGWVLRFVRGVFDLLALTIEPAAVSSLMLKRRVS